MKIVWLFIIVIFFISCGGGSSEEAKKLVENILEIRGIPQEIIFNICQDDNQNGICEINEPTAMAIRGDINISESGFQKITLSDSGKYILETLYPSKPILLELWDRDNIKYDSGRFTIRFSGFKSDNGGEVKELSAIQALEDAEYLTVADTARLKELKNREVVDRVIFDSLEHNYNLLRAEKLPSSTSMDKVLEVLAHELQKVGISETLPNKIASCENSSCIDSTLQETSKELNITKEEAELIADEVKVKSKSKKNIADGYIIRVPKAIEAKCSSGTFYSSVKIGDRGEVLFDVNLSDDCRLIVPSGSIVDSNNNGRYDLSDTVLGFKMLGYGGGAFITPLTTLLLSKKDSGETLPIFESMVKDFDPVTSASAVGFYSGYRKNQTQKLILLTEIVKIAMREGADISNINISQIVSNIMLKDLDILEIISGLSSDIESKILDNLKNSSFKSLILILDRFDSSKLNLNTLMVNISDGKKDIESAIKIASKIDLKDSSSVIEDVVKSGVTVSSDLLDIELDSNTQIEIESSTPTPSPTSTSIPDSLIESTPKVVETAPPTPTPAPTTTEVKTDTNNIVSRAKTAISTIKKTGQNRSYRAFDDGYYKIGLSPDFSRDNKIVRDKITKLDWQDNEEAKMVELTWKDAKKYCSSLTLGGYDNWRLPTKEELKGIIDYEKDGVVSYLIFENIVSAYGESNYWTSTILASDSNNAWSIYFGSGGDYWESLNSANYIRCVRSNSSIAKEPLSRDKSGVVEDRNTGLAWQDDYSDNGGVIKSLNWSDSILYCNNLKLGVKDDWRLPNIRELQSIIDVTSANPSIEPIFKNIVSKHYWSSSSSNLEYSVYGWSINFNFGYDDWSYKDDRHYVRCVRGGL